MCIWDVNTSNKIVNHQEHRKRVWSVVYNPVEPTMYASGSDDCTGIVKAAYMKPEEQLAEKPRGSSS